MSRRQALLPVLCLFAVLIPAGGRAAGRENLSRTSRGGEDSRTLAGFSSMTPSWFVESTQQGSEYGFAVSSAGDVNGDGYGDVLVGSSKYADNIYREGVVFVFHGSIAALSPAADWQACSGQKGSLFGSAVAAAGDVNGDGYADILIGAPSYNDGTTKTGAAFAYYGSPFGLSDAPGWSWIGGSPNADFGYAVASAGDVNQDGFADVLIGAPWFTQDLKEEGAAFLFLGSSTGLSRVPDWITEGDQIGSGFGAAVSGAGDVNGDGFSDVIVGAPSYDNSLGEGGRVFLFLDKPVRHRN
ncbi:MAG: integrin alpha, partial [Chloroflexi bacterium]|nr:integrin alpha [Chloroflexota bacterium]